MPVIGELLAGRYRVDARLGVGGMGSVWRARDLRLGRDVAVKVVPALAGNPVLAERFDREARALAAVASPCVIAIHDVVTSAGADPFIVMELCPGGSLGDRLDAVGPLPVAEALPLLADAAEGLAALHARGILHRDLAPRNILLAGGRAKLGDLGLARVNAPGDRASVSDLTATGTTVGTLAYLAPELLEGASPQTSSDIYGWGAVAYRTLAGVLPHPAGSVAELVSTRARSVEPLDRLVPNVGSVLASVVARALDVRPDGRPTADELAAVLRVLASAAVRAAPEGAGVATAGGPDPGSRADGPRAPGTDAGALPRARSSFVAPDAPTRPAVPARIPERDGPDRPRGAPPPPAQPGRGSDRYRGPSLWNGELLLVAIVAAVVLLVLFALAGAFGAGSGAPPG